MTDWLDIARSLARAGPNRKLYLPGGLLTTADIPSYLDGTLAGDYGFDPLGLGADGAIEKYRVNEVLHARWAMLAIPGIVIPEALGVPGGVWTETGKVFLDGETGRPAFLELVPLYAAINVVLMAGVEKFRSDGVGPAGFVPFKGKFDESAFNGVDPINPGGPLDFFDVAANPQDLAILKVKEIKNGRLAMVAMLGVFVQGMCGLNMFSFLLIRASTFLIFVGRRNSYTDDACSSFHHAQVS